MEKHKNKAILNANIVLENGILWDGVVIIRDDRIVDIKGRVEADIPDDTEIIDAKGAYV